MTGEFAPTASSIKAASIGIAEAPDTPMSPIPSAPAAARMIRIVLSSLSESYQVQVIAFFCLEGLGEIHTAQPVELRSTPSAGFWVRIASSPGFVVDASVASAVLKRRPPRQRGAFVGACKFSSIPPAPTTWSSWPAFIQVTPRNNSTSSNGRIHSAFPFDCNCKGVRLTVSTAW